MGELWLNGISYSGGGGETIYGEASGAIASFEDGTANPLEELVIGIEPVQAGTGDPSPSNPRAISGWTGAEIHVADGEEPHVVDNEYNISWQTEAGEVYGGTLDVTSGVLTVTKTYADMSSFSWATSGGVNANTGMIRYVQTVADKEYGKADMICNHFRTKATTGYDTDTTESISGINSSNALYIVIDSNRLTGDLSTREARATALLSWLENNPTYVVYNLAEPTTYQITPNQVNSILGTNNIWADCGDSDVVYIRDIDKAFNILWNAVMNSNSGTRSLNLMKGAISETKEDIEEPIKEEEETKEGNDENQR